MHIFGGIFLALTSAFTGVALLFFMVCLTTIIGGLSGWVVGMYFDHILDIVRSVIGIECTNFQLGAALGFTGSFFKGSTTIKKDE